MSVTIKQTTNSFSRPHPSFSAAGSASSLPRCQAKEKEKEKKTDRSPPLHPLQQVEGEKSKRTD
jgi:hypothetical protein